MERLQKIIANSGFCSRRKAEELIENGEVKVNGNVGKLGDKAEPSDEITILGNKILKNEKFYYILNKPKGVLVTKDDPAGRQTIYDLPSMTKLKKQIGVELNYVGRLDMMSEGLLILTNDGELNNLLTHPSHSIEKTYQLRTEPVLSRRDITVLDDGILIDGRNFFAKVSNTRKNNFDITIKEGRNRIIRRVIGDVLGYKIYQLKRISEAKLKLEGLKSGEVRKITDEEFREIKSYQMHR